MNREVALVNQTIKAQKDQQIGHQHKKSPEQAILSEFVYSPRIPSQF